MSHTLFKLSFKIILTAWMLKHSSAYVRIGSNALAIHNNVSVNRENFGYLAAHTKNREGRICT